MVFRTLDFLTLRIGFDFLHDGFNLLQFQVDDVVHEALCQRHVFLESFEVETCLVGERFLYIGIQVDGK